MIGSENADFIALSHLGTGYYLYCFKNSICLYLCEQLVLKDRKDFIFIERSLLITAVGTPPNGQNDYSFTRWFSGWNPPHGEETLIMPTPLYLLNKSTFEPHNNRYQGTITLSVVDCWPCSFTCITHSVCSLHCAALHSGRFADSFVHRLAHSLRSLSHGTVEIHECPHTENAFLVNKTSKNKIYHWALFENIQKRKKIRPFINADSAKLFWLIFNRGHLAVSVRPSVGPWRNIFEFWAVFALLLLPNCPRLDCRVSGLVLLQLFNSWKIPFHLIGRTLYFCNDLKFYKST